MEKEVPFLVVPLLVHNNSGRTVQPAEFKMALIIDVFD